MSAFGFEIPGGIVSALLLGATLSVLTVLGLQRQTLASPVRTWVLVVLRIATAMIAFLVGAQPTWTGERLESRPGRLAVLFDVSRSGSVHVAPNRTRIEDAKSLAARWLGEASEVAPVVLTFGARTMASDLQSFVNSTAANEDDTRLGSALEAAALAEGGEAVGAVVVVSDGADLEGGAIAAARRLGLRVHSVALGDDGTLRDDAIASARADRVGFLRRPAKVRVTVRRLGQEPGSIPVTLSRDGEVIREVTAVIPEGENEATIELPFVPDRLGRSMYQLRIPVADQDAIPQNNERAFLVRVVRDNLRVLLVAGQPSWDQRFLRAFLTREPTTDLISFFILRNTSDMTMADPQDLALIPFPTDELFHEHLGSFDVVLFQNFEYAPYQMASYLPRIRDYVMRGGSFAMIGGPLSFSAAGYAETPLADILPVAVLPRSTPTAEAVVEGRWKPRVSIDADRHPLVTLGAEARRGGTEVFDAVAPLEGLNVVAGVEREGQRLLEHPTLHDRRGEPLPALVAGNAGRGRVMALMTDTSWRWGITTAGQRGDASAYERFWDQALRWLSRDPLLEPARVTTDREVYGPGSRMQIEAVLADQRYRPINGREMEIAIAREGQDASIRTSARPDADGRIQLQLDAPLAPGGYRVSAGVPGATSALATEHFVVESGGNELADPRARADVLQSLSQATGGIFAASPEAAGSLASFDSTRVRSLGIRTERPFASVWAYAALILSFALEWFARRRWGLR